MNLIDNNRHSLVTSKVNFGHLQEPALICIDCGKNILESKSTDYYMLRDELWEKITSPEERGLLLCFDCAQRRLGRPFNFNDFTYCEINFSNERIPNLGRY